MSGYQDYLQPDETDLWALPVIRRYHSLVADILMSEPKAQIIQRKAAMLCLPSFEPEWLVSIEQETERRRGEIIEVRYSLRLAEAEPQIWGAIEESRSYKLDVKTHVKTMPLETAFVEELCKVWHAMLRQTKRRPADICFMDGVNFHFMLWQDAEELVGQAHSPEENSKSGQLVAIGESLRALALADKDQHALIQADLEERISKLQKLPGQAWRFQISS
jgi:hypothetical protein